MKIILALALFASQAYAPQAFAWQKFVNCNNHSLVMDYGTNESGQTIYQLVLRSGTLDYFLKMNSVMASRVNEKREMIVPMRYSEGNFVGYTLDRPYREHATYRVYVDHVTKTVTITIARAPMYSDHAFQTMRYTYTNCITQL